MENNMMTYPFHITLDRDNVFNVVRENSEVGRAFLVNGWLLKSPQHNRDPILCEYAKWSVYFVCMPFLDST